MPELTDFQKQYLESLRIEEAEQLAANSEIINKFKDQLAQNGISLTDDNFKYYQTSGIIANYPGIISVLNDTLVKDKEGLLRYDVLINEFQRKPFAAGYLYADEFALMAHHYFRRGYHPINSFSPCFIELFWGLKDNQIEKYIALDSDSVRVDINGHGMFERDTWFGANFDKEIASIADDIVKLRPPLDLKASLVSFFFANAYSLDIKWVTKEGIKTFQAEEFKTEEVTITKGGEEYFPARYIHAEYDLEKKVFRHFDGAIHFYTLDEYIARRDSDFNYNMKNANQIKTISQKLFKMNGIVPVEKWIEFTSHFFTGNPLIIEYFEGEYPQHIKEMLEKVKYLHQHNRKDSLLS
ncbi:hypothetical protein SNE25_11910 [Mucilaginibacter sabulilitoris]|uniref:Uncharacterized protein n=1 Tax=Mucilaginibacter sabulilitoris TaxID=1173583 RepID=A0ABZ0TSY9_9SPHI|nr:hypothetical protein [Mucilaginibacter sabulilitoris]WPU96223.1 hypothetical protein SNE25_11910 [Mucilaginibacter sabulilitoris]